MDQSLPRSRRIVRSREFHVIRERGRRLIGRYLIANVYLRPHPKSSRLGVIASKRVGGAVVRNRSKRLMRESYRLLQHRLSPALDMVLIARRSIRTQGLADVTHTLEHILQKEGLLGASQA